MPVLPLLEFAYNVYIFIPVTDWMLQRDPKEELLKAFRLFDDDQTGKISLRNLRRVARELGENMSEDELRAMIDEFDTDNDGESKLNTVNLEIFVIKYFRVSNRKYEGKQNHSAAAFSSRTHLGKLQSTL